jgi:Leucine-rich repeat (LRR) protein
LELEVYGSREGEALKLLGRTPTPDGAGVLIPACVDLYVKPINRNLTDEDLSALVAELKQRSILELILRECYQITDAGLAHLKELKGLAELDLGNTQITDAGLAHLKELKGLTELDLSGTRITDAGFAHLKELKGLTTLYLWGTQITDAGLANLKELKGLTWLNIAETQITDAGLEELRSALPKCEIVR